MNSRLGRSISLASRVLLLAAFCLPFVACSGRTDTLDEIQERGLLYIGIDPTYPPFAALAPDGGLYGLDVDLGRELADRLFSAQAGDGPDVEPNFVLMGYDGLYHALGVGQVDVLISALVVEPGRMGDFAYSTPYFDTGTVLASRPDGLVAEMEELTGRRLAVEYATDAHVEARRWRRRLGDLSVLPLTTAEEALAAAAEGAADAALVDHISALLFLRDHPGELLLAPVMITSQPLAVVVRAEDAALLRVIDEALEALAADGTWDLLLARWLAGPAD